jgi:hypothetical protein
VYEDHMMQLSLCPCLLVTMLPLLKCTAFFQ